MPTGIQIISRPEYVLATSILLNPVSKIPEMSYGLTIYPDLTFGLFLRGCPLPTSSVYYICPEEKIKNASDVANIASYLKNEHEKATVSNLLRLEKFVTSIEEATHCLDEDVDETVLKRWQFLIEQMKLSFIKKKALRYSPELLSLALTWSLCSPNLYKRIQEENILSLPTIAHLKRLSKAFDFSTGLDENTLKYIAARTKNLTDREKVLVLMIDEIHSAKRIEYVGGKVQGLKGEEVAKTVLCLMIKSIAGKFRDVVSLTPTVTLNSTQMKQMFDLVVPALLKLQLKVIACSVDNFTANRKFYVTELCHGTLETSIDYPYQNSDGDHVQTKIFLLFDTVHNLKNIYNNFLKKKMFECPDFRGEAIGTPCFDDIVELYHLELGKPVKMAHKLNEKMLHPSAIEKTNVSLADSLFHESTIAALEFYGKNGHKHFKRTVPFLRLIRQVWNIANVKTPTAGARKRDEFRVPIQSADDWKLRFLEDVSKWLKTWKESGRLGLSQETFLANIQSFRALADLSRHLIQTEDFQYVLPGQIQSDDIERRFSWLRHLAGSNYFVSVRQILESEKVIKITSLVRFSKMSLTEAKELFSCTPVMQDEGAKKDAELLLSLMSEDVPLECNDYGDRNIIYYVSGYIAKSILRTLKCEDCRPLLTKEGNAPLVSIEDQQDLTCEEAEAKENFLLQVNRGGLINPSDLVYLASLWTWNFYKHIISDNDTKEYLLGSSNQLKIFVKAAEMSLPEQEQFGDILCQKCKTGHSFTKIYSMICTKMFNCIMKNFVSETNSKAREKKKRASSKSSASRKIAKLQSNTV